MFKKGKDNYAYVHGKYISLPKCKNCNKKLSNPFAKRCKSCNEKRKQLGKGNPNYKKIGTKRISNNYVFIKYGNNWWQKEHTYNVEKYLNRKLRKGETIHHIDGNTLNNKLKNLYLFPKAGLHACFENLRRYKIIDRFSIKSNLKQIKEK